jgi:hypothetical protein
MVALEGATRQRRAGFTRDARQAIDSRKKKETGSRSRR